MLHLSYCILLKKGLRTLSSRATMQVFTQKTNALTGSSEWAMEPEDYDFHQEIARSGFADMLHDTERNQKYYVALKKAIDKMHAEGKKANVLDIGTGTGLLSIMAAQCGADSIVACEAFQPMAECALKILKHNNVADKITIIPKRSTEITVGEDGDMKERANILVTEVFDTELIGEGALGTFSHAHKCLLQKDCIVVPDSAVVYVQVVECPTLQKWNKLNDLADEDLQVILKTPAKMKSCGGSAAVHDIQLSQLPCSSFRQLSEPLPVFYYDWSGREPIDKRREVQQQFTATETGVAQMVFMWWELIMDTEGTMISCAPWWCHPDADRTSPHPADSIPWRDHWMQAVYYFPRELAVNKSSDLTLVSCQDEYSLWFYLENDKCKYDDHKRTVCECGVHMALSRTHVSYLNDGRRTKRYLAELRDNIDKDSVVLNVNGGSFLGLAAAAMGAKTVYYVESNRLLLNILKDYASENGIQNVEYISNVDAEKLKEVTHFIGDPNFTNSILPWDNLRVAYTLHKYRPHLGDSVWVLPKTCTLWALPVQFLDLQKIRIPLGECEGVDLSIFDKLVEGSRRISDDDLEAQPLWEYPCISRGTPQRILTVDLQSLQPEYTERGTGTFVLGEDSSAVVNGVAVWAAWGGGGGARDVSGGPLAAAAPGSRVAWDPHTRQAIKILEHAVRGGSWSHDVSCDLRSGKFNIKINVIA